MLIRFFPVFNGVLGNVWIFCQVYLFMRFLCTKFISVSIGEAWPSLLKNWGLQWSEGAVELPALG